MQATQIAAKLNSTEMKAIIQMTERIKKLQVRVLFFTFRHAQALTVGLDLLRATPGL